MIRLTDGAVISLRCILVGGKHCSTANLAFLQVHGLAQCWGCARRRGPAFEHGLPYDTFSPVLNPSGCWRWRTRGHYRCTHTDSHDFGFPRLSREDTSSHHRRQHGPETQGSFHRFLSYEVLETGRSGWGMCEGVSRSNRIGQRCPPRFSLCSLQHILVASCSTAAPQFTPAHVPPNLAGVTPLA